jgi:CBS domain-containing protein/Flp pilus assembly pilin Flp
MRMDRSSLEPPKFALQRRLRGRRGSIATEHATVMGMIAVGVLLTIGLAGEKVAETFRNAAKMMGPEESFASAGMGNGSRDSDQFASHETLTESWSAALSLSLALGLIVAPGFIWLTLHRLHVRRSKESLERAPVDPAQHAEAQARFIAKRQQILRALSNDIDALLDSQIEVHHVMTTNLSTILPSTPIREAAIQMNQLEVRHMLVCSSEGRLLGIVSDRDVRGAKGKTVAHIMTRNPITVTSTSMLKPATTLMLDRHISSLPVIDDGRLVGILTLTDLVMAFQSTMQVLMPLAAELRAKTPSFCEPQAASSILEATPCGA